MQTITLTKTEFARLMRNFPRHNVEHKTWKRLKGLVINGQTSGFIIDPEYIKAASRIYGDIKFSTKVHPTIKDFIKYIFDEKNMEPNYSVTNHTIVEPSNTLSNIPGLQTITFNTDNSFAYGNGGNWNTISTVANETDCLRADVNNIRKEIDKLTKKNEENKNMNMINFDFGKVTSDAVRVSMYGVAVKSVDGRYVSYDAKTHSVMDVEIMNMPAGDFLYKMPVAIKDVKAGDVVIHNRVPMFVVETHESTLKVIDIREGTEKEIYLTKSPFGFNFATKVVSLMDMTGAKADESNPFGNMLPFMLMGENKDFDPMMLMLLGQNGSSAALTQNPMMMYFLMKDTNHKDMLPLLMMMNMKG